MTRMHSLLALSALVVLVLIAGCGSPGGPVVKPVDWGDAPDKPYPTLSASTGASHSIVDGFRLGLRIDPDVNGQPSAAATGDDFSNNDDEDGVTFTSPLIPTLVTSLIVVASAPGKLDAWVDFNGDGNWATPGDKIFNSVSLVSGSNVLTFTVPASTLHAPTFARFRFSSAGGLSFTGTTKDGEVEDYRVTIE